MMRSVASLEKTVLSLPSTVPESLSRWPLRSAWRLSEQGLCGHGRLTLTPSALRGWGGSWSTVSRPQCNGRIVQGVGFRWKWESFGPEG